MQNNRTLSNIALLSGNGTSAHETGVFSGLSLNSNALRYYNPGTGARRRKASDTVAMRNSVCTTLLAAYPAIRRIKIKDSGIRFSARIWLHNGRIIHRKAYSLPNLCLMLKTGIRCILYES